MVENKKNCVNGKTKKNELLSDKDEKKIESSEKPIPNPLTQVLETSLGQDLSDVKVHADATAHRMTSLLGAEAFTYGNDIVFGAGKYDSNSAAGQKLIAHELTHVIQQKGGKKEEE
ncbi:MAG TPA: DUF4157 domain-containing protein [Aridibacter sp.]|nr:DUF4157 domain-containing protein [Aridibacter sp.]